MGLMDRMMDRMIINMSVEEKEDMMLEMMPMMMADVDINTLMPEMMFSIGELITLTGIGVLISKASKDEALKEELGALLEDLKDQMPQLAEMMQEMMPMMASTMADLGLMDGMIDLMSRMMPMMMPMMKEMMPTMMMDKMPKLMQEHDNVDQIMPEMMMDIMPHCLETMSPSLPQEDQAAFFKQIAEGMGRAASQAEMTVEEKKNLEEEILAKLQAGFVANQN